jgi:hypothetical protein
MTPAQMQSEVELILDTQNSHYLNSVNKQLRCSEWTKNKFRATVCTSSPQYSVFLQLTDDDDDDDDDGLNKISIFTMKQNKFCFQDNCNIVAVTPHIRMLHSVVTRAPFNISLILNLSG